MRELIYYVASTLDGFIAQKDGSLDRFPWDDEFGNDLLTDFPETFPIHLRGEATRAENKWFDVVLMGRKTYEVGLSEGITNPYPTLDQFLFSRSLRASPDENVELVSGGGVELVRGLRQQDGKAIWLCGGGVLAATLLQADLIDRLIIKLNPVLFGSGIPVFAGRIRPTDLELTATKTYPSGHVLLQFRVKR